MTNQEFSNEFDILYNNIASNQAPGLDEYEKSVFLTDAQESLVLEMITGKNNTGDSFEKTEELRRYLTDITKTSNPTQSTKSTIKKISDKSTLYECPPDLWLIVYESAKQKDTTVEVVPITHDEYARISRNPFRRATDCRVLRLDIDGVLELISNKEIEEYNIRYIKKLSPIVLEDLPEGLSIKGETQETQCKLNPAIHQAILERAVQLAKISMGLIETGR